MRENKVLHVYYGERLVGTMALTESKKQHLNMLMNGWRTVFLSALFHFLWKRRFLFPQKIISRFIRRVCRQPAGCVGTVIVR